MGKKKMKKEKTEALKEASRAAARVRAGLLVPPHSA